jgi:hypothetical protein
MPDLTQTYIDTLKILGDTLVKMTSAEWDAMLQDETPEKRREAARTMLKTQEARLTLANTALASILTQMQENEPALRKGIARLQKSLDTFDKVDSVLRATSGVLGVIARLVPMLG